MPSARPWHLPNQKYSSIVHTDPIQNRIGNSSKRRSRILMRRSLSTVVDISYLVLSTRRIRYIILLNQGSLLNWTCLTGIREGAVWRAALSPVEMQRIPSVHQVNKSLVGEYPILLYVSLVLPLRYAKEGIASNLHVCMYVL